jgi:dihydropyrimidinase
MGQGTCPSVPNKGGFFMDLLIKNGTVITAYDTFLADIAVKDGKIVLIGQNLQMEAAKVIDASGKFVLPGAIDAHTHLQLPIGPTFSADSYGSGTRAAACGGVTTVFDFATQDKGMGLIQTVEERMALCDPQACVDYAFHTAISEVTPEILKEIEKSVEYGVPSFKLYMVYKDMMVDDGVIAEVLERSKETGALIEIHAENPYLIDSRIRKFKSEGKTSAWYHYESRPEFVETDAVKRMIYIAKNLKAPLFIVHLASKEGLDEVTKARDEGYEIYAETCIQYLNFTNEVYKREDGRYFVCSPAIKGKDSQDALWEGIKRGDISTVATDHCPFQTFEKDWGKDDFTKIPNGCMGIENMYPYMLSEANKGRLTFNKVVEVCSTNPAKIFGCAPKKGTIGVGSDADIVIYDPTKKFTVTKDNMHSDVDYTIWEGVELQGYPVMTFSRGRLVYDNGNFVGEHGWGKFVKCYR